MSGRRTICPAIGLTPHGFNALRLASHLLCALRGETYELVLRATSGEVVRAPPFEAVELRVDVLFGDADDEA